MWEWRAIGPNLSKLAANDELRKYVQDRLGGQIARTDGEMVLGPGDPRCAGPVAVKERELIGGGQHRGSPEQIDIEAAPDRCPR